MKPCQFLNVFLTFRHLKPYVLIWFVFKKKVYTGSKFVLIFFSYKDKHQFLQHYLEKELSADAKPEARSHFLGG